MKVLYLTGIPAPYRVDLFNNMGKSIQLTVVFLAEYQNERNKSWQSSNATNFNSFFINSGALNGKKFDLGVVNYLKKHATEFDVIVVHGYSFTASLLAIAWMKRNRIDFGIEADGAIIPDSESFIKIQIKKFCFRNAKFILSSGKLTNDYLMHYGVESNKCYVYPFSSISLEDIVRNKKISLSEKELIREKLGIKEKRVILTVSRLISNVDFYNNFNYISKSIERLDEDVGLYCICIDPLNINIEQKGITGKSYFHLIDNVDIDKLYLLYACADMFVLLSDTGDYTESIVNAIVFDLPIIASPHYAKYVKSGINGYIIDNNDENSVFASISNLIRNDEMRLAFGASSFDLLTTYTYNEHSDYLKDLISEALVQLKHIHKDIARQILNIRLDTKVILYVGQMIYRKGIDVLLDSVKLLPDNFEFYLIGQENDTTFSDIANQMCLKNVYFYSFMNKEQLKNYFLAADVFVLPTREDVWGLVINEALNFGLPIISTNRCIAACEMLPEECIVNVGDSKQLAESIMSVLDIENENWQMYALSKSIEFSIDHSSEVHIAVFNTLLSNT